ncbi:unnamed protein product [Spirodela intermedia]|uniref:TF-B3 domain-containing protein n=1 Tax=Spirodela intermedia TaxID=51605 RepID=A0A7I8KBB4_SPIIN|nr:unnamed protein product [Spirodela intermedia]
MKIYDPSPTFPQVFPSTRMNMEGNIACSSIWVCRPHQIPTIMLVLLCIHPRVAFLMYFYSTVPPKFARLWGDLLDETAHLEDSDGRRWQVKVSKMDGCLAFGKGWDVFVLQHSIVVGEMLVFKYAEVSTFIVQIFGKSACERRHFRPIIHDDRSKSLVHCSSRRKRLASEWLLGLHGNAKKPDESAANCCGKPEDSGGRGTPNRAIPSKPTEHQTAAAIDYNEIACIFISDDENVEEEKRRGPHKSSRQKTAAEISNSEYFQTKGTTIADDRSTRVESQRNLIMELPISRVSNWGGAPPKERGLNASEDCNLRKTIGANNAIGSEWMPSLGRSKSEEANQYCYDTHVYQFLVDGQGTCHIVHNSIFDPGSHGNNIGLSKDDVNGIQKSKLCSSSTIKRISSPHDIAPKKLSTSPTLCGGREEYSAKTDQINGKNDAQNAHLEALCQNAEARPAGDNASVVRDHPEDITEVVPLQEEKLGGSSCEYGVKGDAIVKEDEKLKPSLEEAVLKEVKIEILSEDEPLAANPPPFSFSLVVDTLTCHELPDPIPSILGRKKLERKVVPLRDPDMRIWPVVYLESFRFLGFLGGWEAFVVGNGIREGDTCHFEMVDFKVQPVLQIALGIRLIWVGKV